LTTWIIYLNAAGLAFTSLSDRLILSASCQTDSRFRNTDQLTEDIYKIYAESFRGSEHLHLIETEAQSFVNEVLKRKGSSTDNSLTKDIGY